MLNNFGGRGKYIYEIFAPLPQIRYYERVFNWRHTTIYLQFLYSDVEHHIVGKDIRLISVLTEQFFNIFNPL